jgi:resuscitation-promoting factor RpfA
MKILNSPRAALGGAALMALTVAGVGLSAAPANAASISTWDRVADCESSGNWGINTGNGYYGGLQFSLSTWRAYGGYGMPQNASKSEQIRIAEKVLAGQGWGAWPVCSIKAHASGGPSTHAASTVHRSTTHKAKRVHKHSAVRHSAVKLSGKTYQVKSGDTLSQIATKKHVDGGWHRLFAANTSRVNNPNLIFIGQILRLPA